MPDLTLYTNPMSRGRIARWMMEEVGESYETVLLDYGTTMKAPDYLAINPVGKVPPVKYDGVVVTEGACSARLRQREPAQRASQVDDAGMARIMPPQMAPNNQGVH